MTNVCIVRNLQIDSKYQKTFFYAQKCALTAFWLSAHFLCFVIFFVSIWSACVAKLKPLSQSRAELSSCACQHHNHAVVDKKSSQPKKIVSCTGAAPIPHRYAGAKISYLQMLHAWKFPVGRDGLKLKWISNKIMFSSPNNPYRLSKSRKTSWPYIYRRTTKSATCLQILQLLGWFSVATSSGNVQTFVLDVTFAR